MADIPLTAQSRPLAALWREHRIWGLTVLILLAVAIVSPTQAGQSVRFALDALAHTAPYLILSIGIAAYASASGADNLIARAFSGAPVAMVLVAALMGALSPFCSCGVIPLIAALLAMGVPLSAVMAFWLASPVMDPSMFALTAGVLGWEFAIAKTLAAIGLGLLGGYVTMAIMRSGALSDPLRPGVGNGGCGASTVRAPKPVVWKFWTEPERRSRFWREAIRTTMFLAKWLTLAFVLESLMLAFVPAQTITGLLGGSGVGTVFLASVIGVPAYLNGYAALPLVGGLIDQGMAPGAGLAFLVAGGVSSLPAAIAVWALARPPVFALYLGLALIGSITAGLIYGAIA